MDVATGIVAAVWLYLVLGHGRFWWPSPRLPVSAPPQRWPAVTVVVPARNERATLARTLPTLVAQNYPGRLRVIVVDDCSDDGTAALAAGLASDSPERVQVLTGRPRPDGWAGKLWAVDQGITAALADASAPPDYLLLTDADIAHRPDSVRRLVAWARADRRDMVSLMARLPVLSAWERLLIPAFVYFFAQLYPFRRVAGPGRTAAAAGGCILVDAAMLVASGGVAAVRGAVIDDVSLARLLKDHGARLWLGFADDVESVRPYPGLAELWRMVSRSAYTQLRHQPALVAATVAGLAALYLLPPAAVIVGVLTADTATWVAGAVAWGLTVVSYAPMVRYHRLPWIWTATLPVAAVLYGAMTVDSARQHHRGGVTWKGRRY